jgi:hypothetical protein
MGITKFMADSYFICSFRQYTITLPDMYSLAKPLLSKCIFNIHFTIILHEI